MAKYRPPEFCSNCGKQLKAVYKNQSGVPFIRYEPCDCNKVKKAKSEEIKTVDIILENRQLKKEIAEGRKEIERLKGLIAKAHDLGWKRDAKTYTKYKSENQL